jgi:hypothetical protein
LKDIGDIESEAQKISGNTTGGIKCMSRRAMAPDTAAPSGMIMEHWWNSNW